MMKELPEITMPEWLKKITSANIGRLKFPLRGLLKDSLYYPCARFDGLPINKLGGNVLSFIYVDYGVSREEFDEVVTSKGFRGYEILGRRSVKEKELIPGGWTPTLPRDFKGYSRQVQEWIEHPFAEWVVLQRTDDFPPSHGPERFSLLYICADGDAAFQALYVANKAHPAYVALIQPGHGFGGNYANYFEPSSSFAETVLRNHAGKPDFILYGGYGRRDGYDGGSGYKEPCWKEYPGFVAHYDRVDGYTGIWNREKRNNGRKI